MLWEARLSVPVTSQLARVDDIIVFGAGDGSVHAVSAISGKPKWKATCGEGSVRRVAANDKLVIAGCNDRVVATNLAGKGVWKAPVTAPVSGGVALDTTRAYAATEDGLLLAFDVSSGEEVWRHQADTFYWGAIAAGSGHVWAADHDGVIHAVSASDGKLDWSFKAESRTLGGVIAHHGRLYFGDVDGNLYAIE
jgi:outer membrane protein assembly factor BamB